MFFEEATLCGASQENNSSRHPREMPKLIAIICLYSVLRLLVVVSRICSADETIAARFSELISLSQIGADAKFYHLCQWKKSTMEGLNEIFCKTKLDGRNTTTPWRDSDLQSAAFHFFQCEEMILCSSPFSYARTYGPDGTFQNACEQCPREASEKMTQRHHCLVHHVDDTQGVLI